MKDFSDMSKRAEQIAEMDEAQLVHRNSKAMTDLELIWAEVSKRLDARAGDDRCGSDACLSADAEAIMFDLKSLHRRMDHFAAIAGGVPVARSGER